MKLTPSEFFVCRLSTHNLDNRKLDVFSLRFLIFIQKNNQPQFGCLLDAKDCDCRPPDFHASTEHLTLKLVGWHIQTPCLTGIPPESGG